MEKLCFFLLKSVFPQDLNVDSECSPSDSFQFYTVEIWHIVNYFVWLKSLMQFDFNFFCKILQGLFTRRTSDEHRPLIFVILLCLDLTSSVADFYFQQLFGFDEFLFFLNDVWICFFDFLPKLNGLDDLLRSINGSAKRALSVAG